MTLVGVTGGIGSGKTEVCSLFEKKGVPVFPADTAARRIMEQDRGVLERIGREFGGHTVDLTAGSVNAKELADIVFHDVSKLSLLNSIIHPLVFREFDRWANDRSASPYAIAEAALLFESGMDEKVDYVLVVTANERTRISRVRARDGASEEEVIARMRQQMDPEEAAEKADFTIGNDGTMEDLSARVDFLHTLFLTLSNG